MLSISRYQTSFNTLYVKKTKTKKKQEKCPVFLIITEEQTNEVYATNSLHSNSDLVWRICGHGIDNLVKINGKNAIQKSGISIDL